MIRGSVGPVTYSTLKDNTSGRRVQVVKQKATEVTNPQTQAQIYQRAIMATVMQAYSAGKVIFDHAFEGYSVGRDNQQRFMSLNVKLLRSILANTAMEANPTHTPLVLNAPGTSSPLPNMLQISDGSLDAIGTPNFEVVAATAENQQAKIVLPNVATNTQSLAEYMADYFAAGEIYTIVGFAVSEGDNNVYELDGATNEGQIQPKGQFVFVRLMVKTDEEIGATKLAGLAKDALWSDVFKVDSVSDNIDVQFLDEEMASEDLSVWLRTDTMFSFEGDFALYSVGVISSIENSDKRSKSFMTWTKWQNTLGILPYYIVDAYRQGSQYIGQSDLILEGSDF